VHACQIHLSLSIASKFQTTNICLCSYRIWFPSRVTNDIRATPDHYKWGGWHYFGRQHHIYKNSNFRSSLLSCTLVAEISLAIPNVRHSTRGLAFDFITLALQVGNTCNLCATRIFSRTRFMRASRNRYLQYSSALLQTPMHKKHFFVCTTRGKGKSNLEAQCPCRGIRTLESVKSSRYVP